MMNMIKRLADKAKTRRIARNNYISVMHLDDATLKDIGIVVDRNRRLVTERWY